MPNTAPKLDWEAFSATTEPVPGLGFSFADDDWDLGHRRTLANTPSADHLRFENIPAWLKPSVKAYLAWGWLAKSYSNAWCISHLTRLNHLGRYLTANRPDISQVARLDEGAAQGFVVYMRQTTTASAAYRAVTEVADFARWVRRQYGLAQGFRPSASSLRVATKPEDLNSKLQRVIPNGVLEALLSAAGKRHRELWEKWSNSPKSKRPRGRELLYLQVLKLLAFTPLRVSQVLLLGRNPLRESEGDEAPGVWLRYTESKTHQGEQEVYVPGEAADIVRDAVTVAREVTQELADRSGLQLLFITDAKGGAQGTGSARNLSSGSFRLWLNGQPDQFGNVKRPGFIHRHNITYQGEFYPIEPHQTRHTMATQAYLGGTEFGTVSEALHHRSAEMTGVYVHGIQRQIAELREAQAKKLLVGKVVPLLEDKEVALAGVSDLDLAYYRESGFWIQPNAYGYCGRPAFRGPCTDGDPCWIGPADDPCGYACLTPGGLAAMEEDVDLLRRQAEEWDGDASNPYLTNVQAVLARYEHLRELLTAPPEDAGSSALVEAAATTEETPTFIGSPEMGGVLFQPPPKRPRAREARGPLPAARREGVVDGMTTTERVFATLDRVLRDGVKVNVMQFCREAGISQTLLWKRFPDVYRQVQELRGSDAMTQHEAELFQRVKVAWESAAAAGKLLTISELARRSGLDRTALARHFPQIAEELKVARKDATAKAKAAKKLSARSAPEERGREIEGQLQRVWETLQVTGEHISIAELARRAGVDHSVLYNEAHRAWVDKLKAWNEGWQPEPYRPSAEVIADRQNAKRQWLNAELAKAIEEGGPVTLVSLAKRCGIDRSLLYKEFPDLVERIAAQRDPENLRPLLEAELNRLSESGAPVTLYALAKKTGVGRNVIYNHFPDIVRRIKEWGEAPHA